MVVLLLFPSTLKMRCSCAEIVALLTRNGTEWQLEVVASVCSHTAPLSSKSSDAHGSSKNLFTVDSVRLVKCSRVPKVGDEGVDRGAVVVVGVGVAVVAPGVAVAGFVAVAVFVVVAVVIVVVVVVVAIVVVDFELEVD